MMRMTSWKRMMESSMTSSTSRVSWWEKIGLSTSSFCHRSRVRIKLRLSLIFTQKIERRKLKTSITLPSVASAARAHIQTWTVDLLCAPLRQSSHRRQLASSTPTQSLIRLSRILITTMSVVQLRKRSNSRYRISLLNWKQEIYPQKCKVDRKFPAHHSREKSQTHSITSTERSRTSPCPVRISCLRLRER